MTEQKCVRTYDFDVSRNQTTSGCCKELNSYLEKGWKLVMVTPKPDYNEYIIEREVDAGRKELLKE